MGGIAGIVAFAEQGEVGEPDLIAMCDGMASRGPDDAGLYMYRREGLFVGMAHRRLAIIDLSPCGRQPMATADERLRIVFDGEIYNYQELRRELDQTGRWRFRSQTDTEVLLYGVREWGLEGCLRRIRGMYAFALFDHDEGTLTLVRDPLGVKPLCYARPPNRLIFASEAKAILALPAVDARLNDSALYHYLTFGYAPAPQTLFAGIDKLEAGTYLRVDRCGRTVIQRYWDAAGFIPSGKPLPEQDYVEELGRLMRQSVARRLVGAKPVGVFLTGDLNSSLILALMTELSGQPVPTYAVGLPGEPGNAYVHARKAAEQFAAHHHEIQISDQDVLACFPHMAHAQDEPLADPVSVQLYFLAKLARQSGIRVIQTGEGSDEVLGGNPIYHRFGRWEERAYRRYLSMPGTVRSFLYTLAKERLSAAHVDIFRRARAGDPLFVGNHVAFWDHEKPKLLKMPIQVQTTSSGYIRGLAARSNSRDPIVRMTHVELTNRCPELRLMCIDKMSMATSLETRLPFLDEDLVTFVLTIPSAIKFRNAEPQYLLKKAAEGILPHEAISLRKWGSSGSGTTMHRERIVWYAHARILRSSLILERFNLAAVERLFIPRRQQPRSTGPKIWNLLNLVLWHECWFGRGGSLAPLHSNGKDSLIGSPCTDNHLSTSREATI